MADHHKRAETVAAQRPTVFFCVPSLYRNLLREGLAQRFSELGVKVCVSAGEALPTSLRNDWQKETGIAIVNGYGASETLSLVLINRGVGEDLTPAPGVEIQKLREDAAAAPARIRIKSSTLATGYWHRPEADVENFRDGDFCPADLFEHNVEGRWRFAGREDSLVKISGRWINLVELEERFVMACIDVAEAAAAAVPDDDGVAAIVIFYVLKTDAHSDADGAVRMYAETLPHYQRPRWLRSTDSLPRTATGKLLRRGLREMQMSLGSDGG